MRKNKRRGGFLMTVGLLLIAAALLLTLHNIREQQQADADAAAALSLMKNAMPQETDAPQTLVLADGQGNPLDWPLDAQGEPIPWPVEDGVPAASVTDGAGRTVYWTQLRGEERPAQTMEAQASADALPDDGAAGTVAGQTASVLTDGAKTEDAQTQSAQTESAQTQSAQTQRAQTQSVQTQRAQTQSAQTQSVQTQRAQIQSAQTQHAQTQGAQTQSMQTQRAQIQSAQMDRIPAQQDALSDWTEDAQGALLPWIRDAAGRLTPWPTDGEGRAMSWAQLRQNWQSLLDALSPLMTLAVSQPAFVRYPDMEMPTREIDGRTYIGMLEVPALELSLPVMSEWSYPRLKKAPCRYVGSIYSKDMIICGHNYDRHFGRLKDLAVGEEVRFTDMDGNVFIYAISGAEQLGKFAVEEMLAGDWDLTLFTCTKGGQTRVTVRCRLERYIVGENQDEAQTAE